MSEPFDRETEEIDEGVTVLLDRTEKGYVVNAVETMHTSYSVTASDPAQAADRLRRYFADPGMVAMGVVVKQGDGERVRWRIPSEKTDSQD